LRRIVIAITALVVVGAAAVAYAAAPFNKYTAKTSFSPSKAGSAAKPVPIGVHQTLTATGTNGNRAAPLTDLQTTIYGVKFDAKGAKATCSFATIKNAANDASCPKGALVATANVHALLGPAKDPSATAGGVTPCNPGLRVWNSGGGKISLFFWSTTVPGSAHYCGGVATGSTPPFKGTIKQAGKNVVINVVLASYVSTRVLGSATWGSLIKEDITWNKLTNGKHKWLASVGCKNGKRPWAEKFTAIFTNAADTGGKKQSFVAKGSAKCS
jgi:hypothetical protein